MSTLYNSFHMTCHAIRVVENSMTTNLTVTCEIDISPDFDDFKPFMRNIITHEEISVRVVK